MLKEWHQDLSLITDKRGKSLLIDQLGLPYINVSTELEEFADFPSDLGMMVRLSCFQRQRSPFLYVDGDLYINGGLGKSVWTSNFTVQQKILLGMEEAGKLLELVKFLGKDKDLASDERVTAALTQGFEQGIFGGNNLPALSAYAKETLNFLYRNIDHIQMGVSTATRDTGTYSNIAHPFELVQAMVESYFLTSFLTRNGIEPYCVTPSAPAVNRSNYLLGMGHRSGLICVTPLQKRSQEICDQLEFLLMRKFPDQYYLILSGLREFCI